MPSRKIPFVAGERYHLYARGVGQQSIFLDERDYARFLFLLLYCQGSVCFPQIGRQVSYFLKHGKFPIQKRHLDSILSMRTVGLENFVIMPNHFHISLDARVDGGVSVYMQKALNGYGKYFNARYKRTGHVFESTFHAVHIGDNNQLLYLSAYIHRNPRGVAGWSKNEKSYPWSSFQDYIGENRWGEMLNPDIVLNQFKDSASYERFVDESGAKDKISSVIDYTGF